MNDRATGAAHPSAVDTIVAPATAAGSGERAVLRLSGPGAHEIVSRVLDVPGELVPGRVGRARFDLEGGVELDVILLGWRAPRSVTGEDVVEVHLLGWPVLVTELVRRCVRAGARPARRGEFTRRAVVCGRLTLTQAVAVGRLVDADDLGSAQDAAATLAENVDQLHGALADRLLSTLALIEAHVDFEEEDTEAVSEAELRAMLGEARDLARRLAVVSARQPALDGETEVLLLGAPNAGKSALFGALCPGAETTVSALPGTTRDALEARVLHANRRFRVLDGPGIAPEEQLTDPVDRRAMELYLAHLPAHAVVLHVEDVTAAPDPAGRIRRLGSLSDQPVVEVASKVDLLDDRSSSQLPADRVAVSALTGQGLAGLWEAVLAAAPQAPAPDVATGAEREAAADILPLLELALGRELSGSLPLVSLELRAALERLATERDQGQDLDEAILDRIFSTFCIGK